MNLLENLDDAQREAVTTRAQPLAILAGAGAGKTRVLTRRIAWQAQEGFIDPKHVLAVTFTRKAAKELRERIARLGIEQQVTAGTFHAIALAQLRRFYEEKDRAFPALLERKARLLMPILGVKGADGAVEAAAIATEIEWAKSRVITPENFVVAVARAQRTTPRSPTDLAEIYRRYEADKRKRRLIDFEDLIWQCTHAIESNYTFAQTQRFRFQHLFIDEFQDISNAQLQLVRAWLGDRTDLCVVGDPNQAIFGFAGADPGPLQSFGDHFAGGTSVALTRNYRSQAGVVRISNAAIGKTHATATAVSEETDTPPKLRTYPTDRAEAEGVATQLQHLHNDGQRWTSMAVLYRTNAQSVVFEEALQTANIPFRVRGNTQFLRRPEVKAAIDNMAENARVAPGRTFEALLTDLHSDYLSAPEEQREHADALLRLGREYLESEDRGGSFKGFQVFLATALRNDSDVDNGGDRVELITFHKAKGLEFDNVFVTGLERGYVPIAHAKTTQQIDEERRLLYVALSRARRELFLSWAEQRELGMREVTRVASPWLDALLPHTDHSAHIPDQPAQPATTKRLREQLNASLKQKMVLSEPDAELLKALKEWRYNMSRAAGVPAFVIFHDTTLTAIAGSRPSNFAELADLPGVGPMKLERYGPDILRVITSQETQDDSSSAVVTGKSPSEH